MKFPLWLPGFNTSNPKVIIQLVAICWIVTKLICLPLWLSDRSFPLFPVIDSLQLSPIMHKVLFVTSVLCLLLLIIFPNRKAALVLCIFELVSCLLDQNRWQPWEYQFLFMAAAYAFVRTAPLVFKSWQIIVAGLYFYSGIYKFNASFIHDIWQNLILHRWLHATPVSETILRLGYIIPIIEIAAACCLLIPAVRKLGILTLLCMHVFILLLLGPAGLHINDVVWPWNLLMPLMLLYLFRERPFQLVQIKIMNGFVVLIGICWWILPALHSVGYWDKYLSASLYSGGLEQVFICSDHPTINKEFNRYRSSKMLSIPCKNPINVYSWAMQSMNTAPYPEHRSYSALMKFWNKKYPDDSVKFYLFKPGFKAELRLLVPEHPSEK